MICVDNAWFPKPVVTSQNHLCINLDLGWNWRETHKFAHGKSIIQVKVTIRSAGCLVQLFIT